MTDRPKPSHDGTAPSSTPADWAAYCMFVRSLDLPADFMSERPMNDLPRGRSLFSED